jgi:magnesium transporter
MSKTVKSFATFQWIDVEKPTREEMEALTKTYQIDKTLFEDILEYGHLPKIEKHNDFTFLILRAYAPHVKENVSAVGGLTNKIAFFINDTDLITIHRAHFEFLKERNELYPSSEALMLDIINEILITYEKPLERQSDKMDEFERAIFLERGTNHLHRIALFPKVQGTDFQEGVAIDADGTQPGHGQSTIELPTPGYAGDDDQFPVAI